MKKSVKVIKLIFAALTAMVVAVMLAFTAAGLMPVKDNSPYSRQSTYVEMKDGTRLAVRYILPSGAEQGKKVPAIMETTRYVTEYKKTFLLNALLNLKIARLAPETAKTVFLEEGYAVVEVDARGSGASEGTRDMELSTEEISDMGELIGWITRQEWSNGKVGAYGISYSGNTAEIAAVTNNPGLASAAMLYPDFDVMRQSAFPGGIFNE